MALDSSDASQEVMAAAPAADGGGEVEV